MDSANSSSLHSSNGGGDDEFDSFFHSTAALATTNLDHHPLPPPPVTTTFFTPSLYLPNFPSQLTTLPPSSPTVVVSHGVGTGAGPSSVQPPELSSVTGANPTAPPPRPKKRPRASRRVPTTVLATDTSNFRAMVQEFTGVPSPPFTASTSPFARPRLSLFHSATAPSAAASPSSALGFGGQSQHPSSIQSSTLTFQSLLQPPLHAKCTLPPMAAALVRPQTTRPTGYNSNDLRQLPAGLIASESLHSVYAAVSGQEGGGVRARPRPVDVGNYSGSLQQRVSSCKLNYSGSNPSEFNVEKG